MTEAGPARIVALLTCHNRRDLTLRALQSWFSQATFDMNLGAVLVDDGSADGTADAVRERFPQVLVVRADGSLYWAAGMAAAEQRARSLDPDAIVWLNDDVDLDSDALFRLREASDQFEPAAVVAGALTDPQTREVTYGALALSKWHPLRGSLLKPTGRAVPVSAVHGNVLYVPRSAYEKLSIDGRFQHAYADLDYGLRLKKLGYPIVLAPEAVGRCSRTSSSRGRPNPEHLVRQRLRELNSPRGIPLRSHARFLRRHGGIFWPIFLWIPYIKEVFRTPARKIRIAVSLSRRPYGQAAHPLRFFFRLAVWRIRTVVGMGAVVRLNGEVRFWCPPEWRGMSKLAFTLRDSYETELAYLQRWVRPATTAVDVGAHYGSYTVCLAGAVGPNGKVLAVEPAVHALRILQHNLRLNALQNVQVVPAALGHRDHQGFLHIHGDPSRTFLHSPSINSDETTGLETVPILRLDDLLSPDEHVSFIKIDTEGYEFPVLLGARDVLKRDRPVVLFEHQPALRYRADFPRDAAWNLLADQGYNLYQLDPDGRLVRRANADSLIGQNVLAVPADDHPGNSDC